MAAQHLMSIPVHISVCICTFLRPQRLCMLLDALAEQKDVEGVEVIVIDNDPQQSARPALENAQLRWGEGLRFAHVDVPNISLARNAALAMANGAYLALIDDDELPEADWLVRMLEVMHRYTADVVFAPVLPEFAPGVPDWLMRGGYFERRRLRTGTCVDHRDARSGNVLMRRQVLDSFPRPNAPFDPALGRSGGEDSLFFRQLHAVGKRMVWCDEAPVHEWVPRERATVQWLLRRSYRTGQLFMRTELAMYEGWERKMRACYLSIRALLQTGVAGLLALLCLFGAPLRAFHWLRVVYSQLGKLSSFFQKQVQSYGSS